MASKTDIANRALTKLGDDRIIDLLDDTERARTINSIYNSCRDAELRAHVWNFAVRRVALPRLITVPAFGFSFEYQIPAESLRLIQVGECWHWWSLQDYISGSTAQFQVEGRKILTDFDAPLKLRYIERVDDTGLYDALFVEAFACRLALEACERITQSNTKLQAIQGQYKENLRMALQVDAIENPPEQLPDESWMISRL